MPSEAQKEAGNYPKLHIRVAGLPIAIENRKGTVRSGKDAQGKPWSVVMPAHYGYFNRTVGHDQDQVDVFVGPHRDSEFVCIVNQFPEIGGHLDEHKVMLGFRNLREARAAYNRAYNFKPRAIFKPTTVQRLKEWLKSGRTWGAFHFDARIKLIRLTGLTSNVKPTEFRQPEPKEQKRSIAARVARVAVPALAVGGAYAVWHARRPQVPTPAKPPKPYVPTTIPHKAGFKHVVDTDYGVKPAAPKTPQPAAVKPKGRKIVMNKLAALIPARAVFFNFQNEDYYNRKGASDSIFTAYRKARRIVPTIQRTTQVAEDVSDIASGRKVKDPFYKKSWFKKAAAGAAIAAPIAYSRKVNAWAQQERAFPGSVTGLRKKVLDNAHPRWKGGKPFFASKLKPIELASKVANTTQATRDHVMKQLLAKMSAFNKNATNFVPRPATLPVAKRPTHFDFAAETKGWDVRDPRGRSARVFAPGSRKRDRREKTWDEKVDNIRAMRNAAALAAVAGTGGLVYAGMKGKSTKRHVKGQYRKVIARSGGPRGTQGPVVRAVNFSRKNDALLHRVVNTAADNLAISRPEIPGENVARIVVQSKPARSAALRLAGAGTLVGGGTLAGIRYKKPKLGAALGGIGAGLLLK